jgi:hydantoinase/carbamoylase family amidase
MMNTKKRIKSRMKTKIDENVQCLLKKGDPHDLFSENRILQLVESFGAIGKDPNGGVTRLAFSPADISARRQVIELMRKEYRLSVRVDAWGNIFGRRDGTGEGKGILLTGSHMDSVRNGGRFDGPAGVYCGLEMIRALNVLDIKTRHPIEVAVFTAEEPNQSGLSTIGSRGLSSRLELSAISSRMDDQGVPIPEALRLVGGNPESTPNAVFRPGEVKAFIEVHIEQMKYLDAEGIDLGVVTGVTGIRRRRFTFHGDASHGGSTPMGERQDALVAAAQIIQSAYQLASESQGKAVATIGHIEVAPNSVNVIPGHVVLEMETRSYIADEIDRIDQGVWEVAQRIQERYRIKVERDKCVYDTQPRTFAGNIRTALRQSCDLWGYTHADRVSMAGHDAYHLSYIADAGMLFVPSVGGRSHCPEEWTDPICLAKAARVLTTTFLFIDKEA